MVETDYLRQYAIVIRLTLKKNLKKKFAARGKRGVEIVWWHANNFPQHRFADVFDDVSEDVLARGVSLQQL